MSQRSVFLVPALCGIALGAGLLYAALPTGVKVETGQAAFTDYRRQQPGTVRKLRLPICRNRTLPKQSIMAHTWLRVPRCLPKALPASP